MFSLIVQFIVASMGIGFVIGVIYFVVAIPVALISLARDEARFKREARGSNLVYHSKVPGHACNQRPPKDQPAWRA